MATRSSPSAPGSRSAPAAERGPGRRWLALVLGALMLVPALPALSLEPGPIILVPGLTGAKLRELATGKVVWGNGSNVLFPRDGGYGLARSLEEGAPSRLEAFDVIESLSVGIVVRKKIYGPVLRHFEKGGHRLSSLQAADPSSTFFSFPYDWREDVVQSAQLLARNLEELRIARGDEVLRVSLICQSSGAIICRYFAKYGGAEIDEAERSEGSEKRLIAIDKLVLVGTANGGSLRNLEFLHRGRSYLAGIGRTSEPEVNFSFASIFPDLPCYRRDLFVDGSGRPLEVDLFDPANWLKYGWSIFGAEARERVEASGRRDLFGNEKTRIAFLERVLDRARRVQKLLLDDAPSFAVETYHSIQNSAAATAERAVLIEGSTGWRTLFSGDDEIGDELEAKLAADGDGHATLGSQLWLSPQEQAALGSKSIYVPGGHFSLIIGDESLAALSEIFDLAPGR